MLCLLVLHRRGLRIDILAIKLSDGPSIAPALHSTTGFESHIIQKSHTRTLFWEPFASFESRNMRSLQAMFISDGL